MTARGGAADGKRRGRGGRLVVRDGTEDGPVTGVSQDETDPGEVAFREAGEDARIRREIPPHWEPSRRG